MRTLIAAFVIAAGAALGCSTTPGADASVDGAPPFVDTFAPSDRTVATDAPIGTDTVVPGVDVPVAPDAMPPSGPTVVYVGMENGTIGVYEMNTATAALTARGSVAAGSNPSFVAVAADARHLYAVDETSSGTVGAFAIDPATGALTFLNRIGSGGDGPTHLSLDRAGRYVLVANYNAGSVATLTVETDGRLGRMVDLERPGNNAHSIGTDPDNRFALAPCLGSNLVAQFAFDPTTGALTPNAPPSVAAAGGAGPRHFAFHTSGRYAYVINETNDTVTAYTYDATRGTLAPIHTVSTLPAGVSGDTNTCAEIVVAPSGQFVYGSNRGHDSIAIFSVDTATGRLTPVGHQPTGGRTPRNFTVDATGTYLFSANQASNNVVAFRIDPARGTLSQLGTTTVPGRPAWVGVVRLPGR
jgi:6-phosphogluconolactonase